MRHLRLGPSRSALLALATMVVLVGCGGPSRPPNLVLIIVDTLRADRLGCYGFDENTSPELDALAREGVRFDRVFAESSWTKPATGAMLTGQYPRTLGLYEETGEVLPSSAITLAEALKRHGYGTAGVTANPHLNTEFNFHQGFDRYRSTHLRLYPEPNMLPPAKTAPAPLHSAKKLFSVFLEKLTVLKPPHYFQINVMEVHDAYHPNLRDHPFSSWFQNVPHAPYLRAIRCVSAEIGSFVASLSAKPGWTDTIFVITSDHGQGLDDHPDVPNSSGHGHFLYSSQTRVPLILYSPNPRLLPRGKVIEHPVSLLGLMPTLLEMVGATIPDGPEGTSFLPLIRGQANGLPQQFFLETRFGSAEKLAVFSGKWHYFENRDGYPGVPKSELQVRGVAANGIGTDLSSRYPEVVRRLAQVLHTWEREHPSAPATPPAKFLSWLEREQLRALGYLQ